MSRPANLALEGGKLNLELTVTFLTREKRRDQMLVNWPFETSSILKEKINLLIFTSNNIFMNLILCTSANIFFTDLRIYYRANKCPGRETHSASKETFFVTEQIDICPNLG